MPTSMESSTYGESDSLVEGVSLERDEVVHHPSPYPPSPYGSSATSLPGKTASHPDEGGTSTDGRESALRSNPDPRVPAGDNEAGVDRHPAPASDTVFLNLREEDLELLRVGRRLRVGDHYRTTKGRGVVLDLLSSSGGIPSWRLVWAAQQVCRVTASATGRSELLVRPGSSWMAALRELGTQADYRVKVRESSQGLMVTVWRRRPARTRSRRVGPAPKADLVVASLTRSRSAPRTWTARLVEAGRHRDESVSVKSFNPAIGKVEALAALVEKHRPKSIAFRDDGHVRRLLGPQVRVRQVDLARAVGGLRQARQTSTSRGWTLLVLAQA